MPALAVSGYLHCFSWGPGSRYREQKRISKPLDWTTDWTRQVIKFSWSIISLDSLPEIILGKRSRLGLRIQGR